MDDLDQLYQDILLDHYKHPRNRADLKPEDVVADEENPLCGDHVRLAVALEGGRLVDLRFDGKGCAISLASTSMMTETLKGMTVEEARAAIRAFVGGMRGEQEWAADVPEDWRALSGVRKFPLRVKCATLSWRGLEKALAANR